MRDFATGSSDFRFRSDGGRLLDRIDFQSPSNASSVQEGRRQPRTADAQRPCRGEEWGNLFRTGVVQRFLAVDAVVPSSVMSNGIASHRSVPPVPPLETAKRRENRLSWSKRHQQNGVNSPIDRHRSAVRHRRSPGHVATTLTWHLSHTPDELVGTPANLVPTPARLVAH